MPVVIDRVYVTCDWHIEDQQGKKSNVQRSQYLHFPSPEPKNDAFVQQVANHLFKDSETVYQGVLDFG